MVAVALALAAPPTALGATKTVYAGPPARAAGAPEGLGLNGFYREQVTVRVQGHRLPGSCAASTASSSPARRSRRRCW